MNYLGGNMPTFALNFSRPGAQVVAQYYIFFRLGHNGFRAVHQAARDVATFLSGHIEAIPEFRLLSRGDELPVFAFTTTERVTGWDVFALSRALRERGWQVPAYTFPADRQDLSVLRPHRLGGSLCSTSSQAQAHEDVAALSDRCPFHRVSLRNIQLTTPERFPFNSGP